MDAGYQVNDLTADAPEECIIVEIDPLIVSRLTVRDLFKNSCLVPHIHGRYRAIELLVGAMEEEIVNGCTSGPLFAESISLALISYIGNHFSAHENSLTSPRQELSSARIRLIQDYIMSNMDQSFSLENLAVLANLSAQHLCFSFKKSMGITPYQFVLRCRIERAKQLLHEKDVSIAETALAVGFSSQSHFSDRFRRLTGLTPGEYRRTLGI
jgi:AraC family transcriptional regulator